jgi:hypothetical protein
LLAVAAQDLEDRLSGRPLFCCATPRRRSPPLIASPPLPWGGFRGQTLGIGLHYGVAHYLSR